MPYRSWFKNWLNYPNRIRQSATSFVASFSCRPIKNAMGQLGLQAERAGLTINLTARDDLPDVLTDQRCIEQVLVNNFITRKFFH